MVDTITVLLLATTLAAPVHGLKRPALTIPQGQVESRLNPKAAGKAGEQGAWQVLPADWGKVPRTLQGQGLQHEQIMDELIQENKGDISKAIMSYNSRRNKAAGKRYLAKVRLRAFEYHFIA